MKIMDKIRSEEVERYERSICSVLSGKMQDRMGQRVLLAGPRFHPNYLNSAPCESPRKTRAAIDAAFLLRLVGADGLTLNQLGMTAEQLADQVVPNLVDTQDEKITYEQLRPMATLRNLTMTRLVTIGNDSIVETSPAISRTLELYPEQVFTVYPPTSNRSVDFAARVLDQYTLHECGLRISGLQPLN